VTADDELRRQVEQGFIESLAQVPQRTRTIIGLHYFEGLSVEEIAQVLRMSPDEVRGELELDA
jgi:DNA-directed RNA polymerase specialized sigma24 family protein